MNEPTQADVASIRDSVDAQVLTHVEREKAESKRSPRDEVANNGKGLSVREAAQYFEETGLAKAVMGSDDADEDPHQAAERGLSDARNYLEQERGATRQTPKEAFRNPGPDDGPATPVHIPDPVKQQYQAVQQRLATLTGAYQERQAALRTIEANRAALVQQHGIAFVLGNETRLRQQLSTLDAEGDRLYSAVNKDFTKRQAAAQRAMAEEQRAIGAARERELMNKHQIRDRKEFDVIRQKATELARADGWTTSMMQKVMRDDALVRRYAWSYFESALVEHERAAAEAERKVAASRARKRRMAADKERSAQWSEPRDGSLDQAARSFARLGIV